MHAKTNSEVTSLAASSPTRSPPRGRPVYYVQSPSHDGEKNTASVHSTPRVLSPMGSPPHSHSSVGRHSRESSTSRFSGLLKPGAGKISPNDSARGNHRKGHKQWKEPFDSIEEEGLLDSDDDEKGFCFSRRCYLLAFFLGFIILFSLFSLILWGASRSQKPVITMQSITFYQFSVSAGSDSWGVATEMVAMNSTVKFKYRNTATFFGVHVTSTPLDLQYLQLTVGTGTMNYFYQSRKSQRTVTVVVSGNQIPLYGGGASLSTSGGNLSSPVDLNLNFKVRSRAFVLGKLVKPKFYRTIGCSIIFNPKKLNVAVSLKNCTYN